MLILKYYFHCNKLILNALKWCFSFVVRFLFLFNSFVHVCLSQGRRSECDLRGRAHPIIFSPTIFLRPIFRFVHFRIERSEIALVLCPNSTRTSSPWLYNSHLDEFRNGHYSYNNSRTQGEAGCDRQLSPSSNELGKH